ncbi:outer membrane protein [Methylobacterium oryzae CBMB20]
MTARTRLAFHFRNRTIGDKEKLTSAPSITHDGEFHVSDLEFRTSPLPPVADRDGGGPSATAPSGCAGRAAGLLLDRRACRPVRRLPAPWIAPRSSCARVRADSPARRNCPVVPAKRASDASFVGGAEIGYDWQLNSGFVAGAAADHQFTRLWGYDRREGAFPAAGGGFYRRGVAHSGQRLDDLTTVRGRLGFAIDRTLVYATGGLAVGNIRTDNNLSLSGLPLFDGRQGGARLGYVAGAGVEHAFSEHLSAKVEGLYYDLGSRAVLPAPSYPVLTGYHAGSRVATDGFLARVGLNYRFGAGLPVLPAGRGGRCGGRRGGRRGDLGFRGRPPLLRQRRDPAREAR